MPPNGEDNFEAMLAAALGGTQHDAVERAVEEFVPVAEEALPDGHKSGFVAVIGQPNVGKSTLMNAILGEKVAIVSPKPQTTRIRQLGILTRDDLQIVFVDTPGMHRAYDDLGAFMMEVAKGALDDADLILFLVDASQKPAKTDEYIVELLQGVNAENKVIQVLNKLDLAKDPDQFKLNFHAYREMLPQSDFVTITALDGYKVPDLLEMITERMPEGPRYYPREQVSDSPLREIAAEMIREQVLKKTEQEVPHSIAVEVDDFKRRTENLTYIHATIYTERSGQKGIIIGKRGAMIKTISTDARAEIETFLGTKIYLEVAVKVLTNWRKDENALKRFGYKL